MSLFTNDRHALYLGWVLGSFIASGHDVCPVQDEHGNYLPQINFKVNSRTTVTLAVPTPPPDWEPL